MKTFDLEKEVMPSIVNAICILGIATDVVYEVDWLLYLAGALMLLLIITDIVLYYKVVKSKGIEYASMLNDSSFFTIDVVVIELVGMMISYAIGSQMFYAWGLIVLVILISWFIPMKKREKTNVPAAQK